MKDLASKAVSWPPRRTALIALGLAAAAAASLALVHGSSRAVSDGSAYDVVFANDENPSGSVLETTITSDEATVDIGPVNAQAQTYNGAIPGPTLSVDVGDTIIVHYKNELAHASGVHWHGIELANGLDGTPFTQNMVEPGDDYLYKFTVERPGIYWYHPHHHASTNQVFKGLYGMILVKDPNEDQLQSSGVLPSDANTYPIVLSDVTVCKNLPNDTHAYNDNDDTTPGATQPWAGSGGTSDGAPGAANALPHQLGPTPSNLCQGPGVNTGGDLDPYPVDEDGNDISPADHPSGAIPNIQTFDTAGRVNEGQTVLTNGVNVGARGGGPVVDGYVPNPVLQPGATSMNVRPGQGLRLQVLNASAVRYMRLRLTRANGTIIQLRKVGGEGGLLNEATNEGGDPAGPYNTKYEAGEILVPPGSRTDVVAAIPAAPTTGLLTLWTRDYDRTGLGFSRIPTVPVMHLNLSGATVAPAYTLPVGADLRNATGDPVDSLGAATGNFVTPSGGFVAPKLGSANQNMALTQGGTEAGVDGTFGTHDVAGDYKNAAHLGSTRYAKQGDVLELTTENTTDAHHPFHLHGFSIQPVAFDGIPFGAGGEDFTFPVGNPEFRDNVDIPPDTRLRFRVRIDPRPLADGTTAGGALGRWVFHCHIFFHATDGMLSELVVTNPSGNERPNIDVDDAGLTVRRGHTAVVRGSFDDIENNSISLSSSAGSITDDGGGEYTWRLRRPRGADRVVYLTATDSNGLKGQIPFHLNKWPEITRLRERGNKLRFKLSEDAKVRIKIRRVGGGARKNIRRNFNRAGAKKIKLRGLPPGLYRLTAVATDDTGLKSRKYKLRFGL